MNLAMCIPSGYRANIIGRALENGIDIYRKHNIDIYVYHKDDDIETIELIKQYNEKGYDNIVGVPVEAETCSAIPILLGKGLRKNYDYVWPIKDKVWVGEQTLSAIDDAMHEECDVIFIGAMPKYASGDIRTRIYDRPEEFYHDWGFQVTSIDVNIFKKDTMMVDITQDVLENYDFGYIYFQFLFEQISKKDKKVKALVGNNICIYNLDGIKSSWKEQVIDIWMDRWIEVNDNLPSIYDGVKAHVIKNAANLPWIFGSVGALLDYHKKGIITKKNIDKILEKWDRISDIPKEKLIAIVNDTYDAEHDIDLIPDNIDELINLFVKLGHRIKEKQITKEQIPYNSILKGISNRAIERYNGNGYIVSPLVGVVKDVLYRMHDERTSYQDMEKDMQLLIVITVLLNKWEG